MSVAGVLNLTPHEVSVAGKTFPASKPAARAVAPDPPKVLPHKSEEMGLPVIEPYDYTEFEGLPREELKRRGWAVIVSQVAAEWLRAQGPFLQTRYLGEGTSLYTPDTDKGAVRNAGGTIVGTTRLIFQFETA